MAKCKYYASNGKPSQLFDRLYSYYAGKGMGPNKAELAATTSWLATRTDNFKDFAGDLYQDNTNPKTAVVDANGEPAMVYFGESAFYADMLVEDYKTVFSSPMLFNFTAGEPKDINFKYPFFMSIKNPKVVNVEAGFTKDQMALATQGVDKSEYDGVIFVHTKPNGEEEKLYSVFNTEQLQQVYSDSDRKINTEFTESPNRVRLETIQDNSLLAEPVTGFVTGLNNTGRFLETALKGDNEELAKMARSVLIKTNKSIPIVEGAGGMIGYNEESNQIVVDPALTLSRNVFNNILFAETVRGYTLVSAASKEMVGMDNVVNTGNIRFPDSDYKKYFKSTRDFINGVFADRNFLEYLKDTRFPGAPETLLDTTLKQIGDQFGFRESYIPYLQAAIEQSIYSHAEEDVEYFDKDINDKEEEKAEPTPPTVANMKAPYAHLVTGDTLLDKHIGNIFEKLQSLRQRLNKKGKEVDNAKIRADILKYQKDLNVLTEKRAVESLIDIGVSEMYRMKTALNKDIGYKEAWENLKILEGWSQLVNDLKDADMDDAIMETVDDISLQALKMYNQYKLVAWDATVSALTKEGIPTQYLEQLTPEKIINDTSTWQSLFEGLSFGQHGIEVATDYLIHNRAYHINNSFNEFTAKQDALLKKLGNKDLSFMFTKDEDGKFRPITSYKNELYEKITQLNKQAAETRINIRPMYDQIKALKVERDTAKTSGDKMAMAYLDSQINLLYRNIEEAKTKNVTNHSINEFMRNNFNYEVTDDGRAEFQAFAEEFKEQFWQLNLETGEPEFKEAAYREALKEHDPDALVAWVNDNTNPYPRFAAKYAAVTPKDQWKNPEYDKFSDAQKEFYDFFVEEYLKAQANVPMDYSFTEYNADLLLREFAYMNKTTADTFTRLSKDITNFVKDIATVEYSEDRVSYDVTGPLSGKQVKKLKFKPVSAFTKGTDGYWKETEQLPDSLKKGLDEGRYKYKDGYLVIVSKGAQNEKMVKKIVSLEDNPLVIFNNFIKFGYSYKYKREVEDVLNSMVEMASAIPKQASDKKGVVNAMGISLGAKNGSNMEKRLNYTVDAFLHGNMKDSFANKEGVPGERNFSFQQLIENINNFTRVRQLGLNPISGISNLSMGTVNNFMYAGRDEFFNEGELRKAYLLIKDSILSFYSGGIAKVGNSQKIMLMMQQFNMLGNMHEQFQLDKEWMNKLFEHMYIFQKGGEYLNQGAVAIAMMLREKIQVDGKEVSLWDAFEVEDQKLKFKHPENKYADINNQFIFAEAVKKVNKEIHGDYDILNPMLAKKGLAGRVGLLFRTWLPQAIKQRVGARYTDYQLSMLKGHDVYREGRWNTFGRMMNVFTNTKKDKQAGITRTDKGKNFLYFIGAIAANTISARAGRKVINAMDLEATDKANMYANVKEAWWLTMITASTYILLSLKGDDDDDEDYIKQSALKYLVNQTSRIENELWFFNSPASFSTIFRDAIPLWSTLQQAQKVWYAGQDFIFDNESDTYKRGFRKGKSKLATQAQLFFPVSKQLQSVWSMWSQIYSNKFR